MSVNYKLVQKKNPQKKSEPAKWYATPNSAKPLAQKALTRAATENTTTAPIEMEAAMELLAAFIPQQLKQGHTVNVPGMGTFRLTFKSEGVEDIDKFNAGQMIKSPRIVFTPAKELRERTLQGISYENSGVLEAGVNYASMADYRKAKGLPTPAPGGSTGGGGSSSGGGSTPGGQGENPLG
ncbi:DNA-binding protein [Bacteroides heparinolyticus]|uniref:DNA-binding protein n=1 Tax=Prevotella heparinolytica TaxID=28113 RepID=A0A449I5I2_9BACE|nr:HU family DNA-binding protein [Bacteroides heparinolyticus]VFB14686.1 DNA-binding protein [Bacteroides heparinolyticus]